MRLRRLQMDRYLLLHDVDLRFDRPSRLDTGQYALDFLVGINGSGKSTILRAIAQILADLRASSTTDFNYTLEYELQGRDGPYLVVVTQTRTNTGPQKHMVVRRKDSPNDPPVYEADEIDLKYLPTQVVIYTTGREAEWDQTLTHANDTSDAQRAKESTLQDVVQRFIAELPGHLPRTQSAEDATSSPAPYLLVRASRLPLVTLCGLLVHLAASFSSDQRPLKDVLASLGLSHWRGFSLRFRLHSALSPRETFERIVPFATQHVRQGTDHLLVFDLSTADSTIPSRLLEAFNGSLNLFDQLNRLLDLSASGQPTLQQINLFFERSAPPLPEEEANEPTDTVSRLFLLDWLSDGEQRLLGRMALLAMLDTDDSLILLDEPEVHFNDYWKREIVNLLNQVMGQRTNHMLIISHSSITLSDVPESQVIVFRKDADGWVQARDPGLKTFGADPSEIMIAVFQAELAIGAYATNVLEKAVTSGTRDEVADLLQRVGPGMWRFRLRQRLEALDAPPA